MSTTVTFHEESRYSFDVIFATFAFMEWHLQGDLIMIVTPTSDGKQCTVYKYMKSQNRPYSVQNVFDNVRGEVPKAKVAAALDVCDAHLSIC